MRIHAGVQLVADRAQRGTIQAARPMHVRNALGHFMMFILRDNMEPHFIIYQIPLNDY
jgi:hypothetical protein